jgi:glutathione S-transferase
MWVIFHVGKARERTGIKAPAVTGNEEFERHYRVQMNMVEQFVLFLPSLWIFAILLPNWWLIGLILGLGWVVGRVIYALGYYKEAKKRGPGFGISILCNLILLAGAFWGVVAHLLLVY